MIRWFKTRSPVASPRTRRERRFGLPSLQYSEKDFAGLKELRQPSRAGARADGRVALAVTLAIQAIAAAAVTAPTAIAPLVADALGVSLAAVGIYVALVYLGAMVSSVVGSHVVTHHGAIRASQIALVLCALGLLAICTGHAWLAGVGAVVLGCGYGPITPASSQILARTTQPERMGLVFSIKQTGVPLGGALAGLIAPPLALPWGWRAALLTVLVGALSCAWLAQPLRRALDTGLAPPSRWPGPAMLLRPVAMVMADARLRPLALTSLVLSANQVCLTAFLVAFLTVQLRWSLVAAGAALSIAQIAGVTGRIVWGWTADRGPGARKVLLTLVAAMISCGLLTAVLTPEHPRWGVWLLLAAYGATAIGWNGVYLAAVARFAGPSLAGVATGGTLALTYLGVVMGPPLFGVIANAAGHYGVAYASLALPLSACLWAIYRMSPDAIANGAVAKGAD